MTSSGVVPVDGLDVEVTERLESSLAPQQWDEHGLREQAEHQTRLRIRMKEEKKMCQKEKIYTSVISRDDVAFSWYYLTVIILQFLSFSTGLTLGENL